jgi:hypothetical protein
MRLQATNLSHGTHCRMSLALSLTRTATPFPSPFPIPSLSAPQTPNNTNKEAKGTRLKSSNITNTAPRNANAKTPPHKPATRAGLSRVPLVRSRNQRFVDVPY